MYILMYIYIYTQYTVTVDLILTPFAILVSNDFVPPSCDFFRRVDEVFGDGLFKRDKCGGILFSIENIMIKYDKHQIWDHVFRPQINYSQCQKCVAAFAPMFRTYPALWIC